MSVGYSESSKQYGGDAYTGIQQASAQSANNIQDLAKIMRTGLGAVLLLGGIALICYFLIKLSEEITLPASIPAFTSAPAPAPFPAPAPTYAQQNTAPNTVVNNTSTAAGNTQQVYSSPENNTDWTCAYCGEKNPETANSCLRCGERKKVLVTGADAPAKAEPGPNEWKCSKCGKINQNYVGTCGCGQAKRDN